jgi:hypothetical protein
VEFQIHWSDEIIEHLAEHDVTPEDFESVIENYDEEVDSRSSGRKARIGWDDSGRLLFCAFERLNESEIIPVTAYEIGE